MEISIYDWEDYAANRENHESYYAIMEEYLGNSIFIESFRFMNDRYPEWNSNKGIGYWAGEFMLNSIQNLEYITPEEEIDLTSSSVLLDEKQITLIHEELINSYERSKKEYYFWFNEKIATMFENQIEENIENEIIPEDYLDTISIEEYNKVYDDFRDKLLSIITYDFIDELIFD